MVKLSENNIQEYIKHRTPTELEESFKGLQVAVYTMVGGGWLGRFAAEQPKDFYIDSRVSRLPYPMKAIYQAVRVLQGIAEALGLDPHNLPPMKHFHNCGVF